MYPFRKILIPTDFSTASEWVFDDAVRVAARNAAEIVILHIRMTWESHPKELRFPADPSLYEYAERQELDRLRDLVRRSHSSVQARLAVKQGPDPAVEIAKCASEENADLIVMSTHARHHVAHLLIGSTTLSVIREPPCPILAIRYGIRKRAGSLQTLLVPVHPGQKSHAALELALTIAGRENSAVHLVTVCKEAEVKGAEGLLQELSQRVPAAKQAIIRSTDVERELIRYATKVDADVIFINAGQELSEKKANIVRHAHTPVMIVP